MKLCVQGNITLFVQGNTTMSVPNPAPRGGRMQSNTSYVTPGKDWLLPVLVGLVDDHESDVLEHPLPCTVLYGQTQRTTNSPLHCGRDSIRDRRNPSTQRYHTKKHSRIRGLLNKALSLSVHWTKRYVAHSTESTCLCTSGSNVQWSMSGLVRMTFTAPTSAGNIILARSHWLVSPSHTAQLTGRWLPSPVMERRERSWSCASAYKLHKRS
jgi:hypothetical protein